MFKPKTTISGRLDDSSGEWTVYPLGYSNARPPGYE